MPNKIYLLTLGFLSIANISYALPTDKEQTLEVSAGAADINQQTHHGIYKNNVRLTQGTTNIEAHEAITIGNDKNQLTIAIIKGNKTTQAHYWTLSALDKPPLHAYADTIKYYPARHLIELIGAARVSQGNNSFAAPMISYDTKAEHVISAPSINGHTTIIFHPEKSS